MTAQKHIWVLEDDPGSQFVYSEILGQLYALVFYGTMGALKKALTESSEKGFDLLIVDLRLPDESFLHFLSSKQMEPAAFSPFLVVSSIDDIEALKMCFAMGARDYLTKPFGRAELLFKVQKCMREHEAGIYSGDICIEATSLTVRRGDKQSETLTPKELQIVAALQQAPNRTMTREQLIAIIWSTVTVGRKAFDVHLFNLRKKVKGMGIEIVYQPPNQYQLIITLPPEE